MSSFITFPNGTIRVSNSTFRAILRLLEERSKTDRMAAHCLEANPIARPVGALRLGSFSRDQLISFISFLAELSTQAADITREWSSDNRTQQFTVDLQALIAQATGALAPAESGPRDTTRQ